ncbi:MAG: endonuclease III [Paludibacteraceae bacterium]|nr:endonuclease III [Paludibacteraceae bacterium]
MKSRYSKVVDYLSSLLPDAESELQFRNPFELIVAVVLSAQCTDKRVNKNTPALFAAYPNAEAMSRATEAEIFQYIKEISYPNSKAAHLLGLAKTLVEKFGGEVPDTMEALTQLPGVGRKTANVVMAVAFGKPAMPVDTHVFRVAHRLGLVTEKEDTPAKVEAVLTKNIPAEILSKAHHWFLLFGRYTCTARNPKCEGCGLKQICQK